MIKTRSEALSILGLGPDASLAKIKAVYKELVKKCHPDVTGSKDFTAYNRITEAYQFLCNDTDGHVLTHTRVMGKTTNADYAAFQKKAKEAKERRKQEFEQKQKDFAAMYEKQEADYKRAMEAIDAIRVARAIQSMIWANGMEKDSDDNKE